ncbi:MAG TPA: hypothetical protein VEW74_03670 [Candidatus Nitrosotalea sp.]|nr:hypothetical protein [Candidatus Nitrosotalea sp.]
MRTPAFSLGDIGVGLSVVLIAGCGGSSIGLRTTPVMTTTASSHRTGSYGDLVYVTTSKGIVVVAYPPLKIVQTLPVSYAYSAICSDPNNGNVYVVEQTQIVVYAHGGTSPIATLNPPSSDGYLTACSIEPISGDLAVSFNMHGYKSGAILIYKKGQGEPKVYSDKALASYIYTTYDTSGDLFFGAYSTKGEWRIEKLIVAKGRFSGISTNIGFGVYKIQSDGTYIVFENYYGKGHGSEVYQLQITGNTGTIVNQMNFFGAGYPSSFTMHDGAFFNALGQIKKAHSEGGIGEWGYPFGGAPHQKVFGVVRGAKDKIYDMAYSVGPTRVAKPNRAGFERK